MEKYVVWYRLLIKAYSRKKMYWLQLLGMALVLVILSSVSIPNQDNVTVGIYCDGGKYSKQLTEWLLMQEETFSFKKYVEKDTLYADVLAGRVECGFLLDKELDRKIEAGDLKKSIIYVGNSFSTKGATIQEKVYAGLFTIYSDEILRRSEADIYGDTSQERIQKLIEMNHEYQNSDAIFRLEVKTADFFAKEEKSIVPSYKTEPIRGMVGLFVFFMMFMAYGNKYGSHGQKVDKALNQGERFGYSCMNSLAAGTIPALAGVLGIICFVDNPDIGTEIVRIILLLVISSIWISLIGCFFKKGSSFAGAIVSLLLVNLFVCPVFMNLETYVPAIYYVRLFFPLGWYLM